MFSNKEFKLPKSTKGSYITYSDKIRATLKQTSALQIQITFKGFKSKIIYDNNKCTVKPISLKGCYKCQNGAELKYSCKTDFGTALANVVCPSQKIDLNCDPKGEERSVKLNYDKELVEEKCQVHCPAGNSEFNLKAKLIYIEQQNEKIENTNNKNNQPTNENSSIFNSIEKFFQFLGHLLVEIYLKF